MGKVRTEDPQLLAAENHPGATHPQGWEWRPSPGLRLPDGHRAPDLEGRALGTPRVTGSPHAWKTLAVPFLPLAASMGSTPCLEVPLRVSLVVFLPSPGPFIPTLVLRKLGSRALLHQGPTCCASRWLPSSHPWPPPHTDPAMRLSYSETRETGMERGPA